MQNTAKLIIQPNFFVSNVDTKLQSELSSIALEIFRKKLLFRAFDILSTNLHQCVVY